MLSIEKNTFLQQDHTVKRFLRSVLLSSHIVIVGRAAKDGNLEEFNADI